MNPGTDHKEVPGIQITGFGVRMVLRQEKLLWAAKQELDGGYGLVCLNGHLITA